MKTHRPCGHFARIDKPTPEVVVHLKVQRESVEDARQMTNHRLPQGAGLCWLGEHIPYAILGQTRGFSLSLECCN
jgi:hypothetical protein